MRIASRYPGAAFVLDEGESLGALLAQGQALAGSTLHRRDGRPSPESTAATSRWSRTRPK